MGSAKESAALADRIEAEISDVKRRVATRPRPRTLLVFGRDAETLRGIYASGGIGFLHDMLEAAGGINVFADVKRQSIQTTSELAVARGPDVIVEIGVDTASSSARNLRAWDALSSIPAVRTKRVYELRGDGMMNPGPRISTSVRRRLKCFIRGVHEMTRKKTLISWSSGKDSAWTLHMLKQDPAIESAGS